MQDIVTLLHKVIKLHAAGQLKQAHDACLHILSIEPDQPDAINFLGVISYTAGDYEYAKTCLKRAIELMPDSPSCFTNMGNVYHVQKEYGTALEYYQQALELDNKNKMALNNIGAVYLKTGKSEEALKYLTAALNIDPRYIEAHNNLGEVNKNLGNHEIAVACFEKALELSPGYVQARWNRANLMMLHGDFPRAWQEYETRWQRPETPARLISSGVRWDGQRLDNQTLFVYEEQGMGDTLQFLRYLPLVKEYGGQVIFEAIPPLLRLTQSAKGYDRLWAGIKDQDTRPTDRFDYHIPLMTIPNVLKTSLETIPADVPYLFADNRLAKIWKKRMIHMDKFKVGIVWAGHPDHTNDDFRSTPLSHWASLKDIQDISLYGLQLNKYSKWTDIDASMILDQDFGDEISDFADTAAIIENLDLVISVDTAVVHLAGAMGKDVWTLLPFSPDWRWLLDRDDSPWYPTMKLFRQPEPGDWNSVFANVKNALKNKTVS